MAMGTTAGPRRTRPAMRTLAMAAAATMAASAANAATFYWDANGAAAGAGNPATAVWATTVASWQDATANPATGPAGTAAPVNYVAGSDVVFSAGVDAATVTATLSNTNQSAATLTLEEGNVTLAGDTAARALSVTGGTIAVPSGSTLAVNVNLATGSANLAKTGAGTLELGGGNSYAGTWNFNAGTTRVTRGSLATNNGVFADACTIQVNAGATLDLNGRRENMRFVVLDGGTIINTDPNQATFGPTGPDSQLTAIVSTSGNYDLRSGLLDVRITGTADLTKTTAGTVTVSGRNSWSGTGNLNGGRTVVTGILPATLLNVNAGATLGGDGAALDAEAYTDTGRLGVVRVLSGGTFDAGTAADTAGKVLVRGTGAAGFTLDGGATFEVDIAGATAGAGGYDQLRVNSGPTAAGATPTTNAAPVSLAGTLSVDLLGGYAPVDGQLFFVLTQDVSASTAAAGGTIGNVGGTFAGLVQDGTFTADGATFQISYVGDSVAGTFTGGNDVVLRAIVPEPASLGVVGLAALTFLKRRRRA